MLRPGVNKDGPLKNWAWLQVVEAQGLKGGGGGDSVGAGGPDSGKFLGPKQLGLGCLTASKLSQREPRLVQLGWLDIVVQSERSSV